MDQKQQEDKLQTQKSDEGCIFQSEYKEIADYNNIEKLSEEFPSLKRLNNP
ncbi:hypothetical protein IMG5_047200 [Ichthyophthirius multifiliis]|uniref:Uncharacterized protein n=1 Tax=Ichthyophthirius multifiliis TaxID=5932 RepID=G0QMA8_ICHMU|nr:hypothetical protein IMG5_047200 [Ichthyophthirius multifiliis]EGR33648.1 hypothetical protein IMG5_047200 [Ichthyophthirius multifiliis]|eukprot:XP_004037634.1 hypothetical protein IMG5_047200 [Ichthyophthirius multifiliis]